MRLALFSPAGGTWPREGLLKISNPVSHIVWMETLRPGGEKGLVYTAYLFLITASGVEIGSVLASLEIMCEQIQRIHGI